MLNKLIEYLIKNKIKQANYRWTRDQAFRHVNIFAKSKINESKLNCLRYLYERE